MAARDIEPILITRRAPSEAEFPTYSIEHGYDKKGWLSGLLKVRRMVESLRPDIVHGHYVTSYGLWAAVSGVRPLVLTAWGSDILVSPKRSLAMRLLTGLVLRRADLITADSLDMLAEIRSYRPRARLEQVQWGVDLDLFRPVSTGGDDGVFRIVSLRMLESNYNIDIILSAFAVLRMRHPDIKACLHVLGDGALESSLLDQAMKLGIADDVIFHGRMNEADLVEVLQSAHISVTIPSNDATAMSLLESMAVGLPVVVSDLPANRQWVDESGGFVVPVGDVEGIVLAFEALLHDRGMGVAMGRRNRAVVTQQASRRSEMDRMADIYGQLVCHAAD